MNSEDVRILVAILGIAIGTSGRTLLPYFQKLSDNPDVAFNWRYVLTALFSAGITALIVLPLFTTMETVWYKILIAAVTFAWASNDIMNNYSKGKGTTTIKIATKTELAENKIKKLEEKISEIKSDLIIKEDKVE
jgi:hypothetical protein